MKDEFLKYTLVLLTGVAAMLVSCEKNDPEPDITANNLKGMFIVCEGSYGSADGDITYYNTAIGSAINTLYYSVNNVEAGDIVQSFAIADTLGFLVVNNSQKVIVVNMQDFGTKKTLTGFSYPRDIVRSDEATLYVSNGNGTAENYIYSIDLLSLEKTDSLEISTGPESLLAVGSKVYAAISGGWNNDGNTVIEIDASTFTITRTHPVGSCPVDLVADIDNNIWVYCKGAPDYSNWPDVTYTNAGISKINTATGQVTTLPIADMSSSGLKNIAASMDGSIIYYLNGALYSMPATSTALPAMKMVDKAYYGLDVDPQTGNIVCLDAVNSRAVVYNTSGVELFDFETGDYPNSAVFSY